MRAEEWLLIEWPEAEAEPVKYFLSTAPSEATLEQLVFVTKMRWRIERDYQELKQEFGLAHYEGRGWRGFHHHATLCIAAYAFLVTERLSQGGAKKTALNQKRLPYPKVTSLVAAGRVQRHVPDSISTLRLLIARAIVHRLSRCPCCWEVKLNL
jgi:SRSO17 transposase